MSRFLPEQNGEGVLGIQMFSLGLIGELIIFVGAGGVKDYQIEDVYETDSKE